MSSHISYVGMYKKNIIDISKIAKWQIFLKNPKHQFTSESLSNLLSLRDSTNSGVGGRELFAFQSSHCEIIWEADNHNSNVNFIIATTRTLCVCRPCCKERWNEVAFNEKTCMSCIAPYNVYATDSYVCNSWQLESEINKPKKESGK